MKALHDTENEATATTASEIGFVPIVSKPPRRQIPPPGRKVPFHEALEISLKEDKELLRRLAQ